ncbi:Meiotic Sister-Chromatid recombination aldehyde dehydrogenase, partial [Ceratobasidium sp. 395]
MDQANGQQEYVDDIIYESYAPDDGYLPGDFEAYPADEWNSGDYTQYYGAAENEGFDIFIPLLLFTFLGIYLVYNRYHTIRNRPIHFAIPAPDASFINWRSLIIPNPHLNSHQDDPMLLPAHSDPAWRDTVQPEGTEPEMVHERKFVTSYDPSTGQHIATIPCDRPIEIHHKIQLAQRAQTYWARSSWVERRRVLRSLLRWTIDEKETIARVCCRDTGKTMIDAAFGEILTTCSKAQWLIKNGERVLRTERRGGNLLLAHKISTVQYEPL